MRFLLFFGPVLVGCTSTYEFYDPPCNPEALGPVAVDEASQAGPSPADAVAQVDGTTLQVRFDPVHDALDAGDAFTDELTVAVTISGEATQAVLQPDGTADTGGAGGPDRSYCPGGPLLTVPVEVSVAAGSGFEVSGVGTLYAMGSDPEELWLQTDSPDMVGAPAWLQERADAVACAHAERPVTLRFGFHGRYDMPDASWDRPDASISLYGEGDGGRCSQTLYTMVLTDR